MHRHEHSFVEVCGRRIEIRAIAGDAGRSPLVFLHEGLGSVAMWRGFPARVAELTGCPTIVYSRYGYGGSDLLAAPFGVDYMHREAQEALPELLAKLRIEQPILVGHSDGASIALIYAGSGHTVRGLVLMAPHVFVEDLSVQNIAGAKVRFETTELATKLARYHADARRTFYGWNDIWLHPDFRRWNIESYLGAIRCPVLAIQGRDDEYGTMAQVDAIAAQVAGPCEVLLLDDCHHSPHRAQHDRTLEAVVAFARRLA
jgi:pimeloyl-ACP methyl ester carboxylesterase